MATKPTEPAAEARGASKAPNRKSAADRAEIFIRRYLIHHNASHAYVEAGYKDGSGTRQSAHRLLTSAYIQQRLAEERQKHLASLDVTVATVLQRYKAIAFADPAQITAFEFGACRYCNGQGHAYQWRTPREYEQALHHATCDSDKSGKAARLPTNEGGYGYSATLAPHPDCPECDGVGIPRLRFKDTRMFTDEERALFAGAEQTQNGTRYKFHDQAEALKQLAEHLQFFRERDQTNANAVARLLHDLHARGEMGRMPIRGEHDAGDNE